MEKFISNLKGQEIGIQCTWANAFARPVWNRGYCIRSFTRELLKDLDVSNVIGFATGKTVTDNNNVEWIEAQLLYTDRMTHGWFRKNDVSFQLKEVIQTNESNPAKSLAWLTGAIALFNIFK